ncbi:ribonuclease H-like domain-containing protein [Tanacetum coccineum]|uniref:Ribonuclease H-like domain-containing protein n=1 Tax=Tanacetum coccineum TaxID=301880 RepID=A0ABQ5DCV1_9ASTR
MMYSGVNTSVQLPYVYLPAHLPPALFASLLAQQLPTHYYGALAMSPAPASYAPALPHAFHTMTLQNPKWNMDTGASSHLADNTDHFSHFVWVYPLHKKSELFDNFVAFRAYINKQFNVDIKALQCDHGGEYDNTRFHDLFRQNGIQFWFSCPRTSQQNGKSERMLRTINNLIRILLFQAHLPPSYWVEALNMAAHLLNILPSTAINNKIPFTKLYNQTLTYEHLRVFGCLCYPHIDISHKLEPCSTPCIFLGYPVNHRGYRSCCPYEDEIKVDKTLRFVEELVEIMDREIKSLKRSKISLVKVHWNSKRGPEFTWEREDYMKSKYPQLFVDRADESAS